MASQRFGNENLTSQFLLNIVKEFRGFLTNTSNSILTDKDILDLNLGNVQADVFFSEASKIFDFKTGKGINISENEKEFLKIKDEYVFDLLDNTVGCYLLGDILSNKVLKLNTNLPLEDYFIIEREPNDLNGNVRNISSSKDGSPFSIKESVTPYKTVYQNTSPNPHLDPSYTSTDSSGNVTLLTGNFAKAGVGFDKTYINESKSPDLKNPSLGSIIIKNRRIGLPSKNADHLNIFFNGIPPIELARCTPYVSIAVVSRAEVANPKNINNVTFMRFIKHPYTTDIKGKREYKGTLELDENIGIKNASVLGYNELFESAGLNIVEKTDLSLMDIFTSSQMMANGNINKDVSAGFFGKSVFGQKVLEPIAPMLSLTSLSVDISGMGVALFSSKVGTISFKLHDRSRLVDISHLIAANQFGSTKMIVEFGWSHPDGGADSNNPIGQYLNALRDRSVYTVKASSFSFGQGNSVDINIGLACYGMQGAKSVPAAAGSQIPITAFKETITKITSDIQKRELSKYKTGEKSELKEVRHLLRAESRNSLSSNHLIPYKGSGQKGERGYIDILEAYTDYKKNPNSSVKKSGLIRTLKSVLKINQIIKDSKDLDQISKDIENEKIEHDKNVTQLLYGKLYGLKEKVKFNLVNGLKIVPGIQKEFNEDHMCYTKSPKPKRSSLEQMKQKYESEEFTTMGRIMLSFIGHPIAVSGMFDEVQMVFYPFNLHAGGARSHTTASLPIEHELFRKKLTKKLAKNVNMSVTNFFSFFEKNIIRDKNLKVYGIGDVVSIDREQLKKEQANLEAVNKVIQEERKNSEEKVSNFYKQELAFLGKENSIGVDVNEPGITDTEKEIRYAEIERKLTKEKSEKLQKDVEKKQREESEKLKTRLETSTGSEKSLNQQKKDYQREITRIENQIKNKIREELGKIYANDGQPDAEAKFILPNISIFLESLSVRDPINKSGGLGGFIDEELRKAEIDFTNFDPDTKKPIYKKKTVCRIHIYDENTNADPKRALIQSLITEGSGGSVIVKSATMQDIQASGNASEKELQYEKISNNLKGFVGNKSAHELRQYIKRGYPSITYGANNSTVQGISVSSNVSDKVSQVIQIASYANRNNPQEQSDAINNLEDMTVVPASVNFNMFGMPFIFRGNQIYIDFGTNTTLDNIYTVKSVKHSIQSGKFETSVSLIFAGQGDVKSLAGEIERTIEVLDSKQKKPI